jgi:hypothetical protein
MPEQAILATRQEARFGMDIAAVANKNALTALSAATAAAPSGPAGAIQFSNVTTFNSDDVNLHFDNTTNCLGVGTNSPTQRLHVVGGFLQTTGTVSINGLASANIDSTGVLGVGNINATSILIGKTIGPAVDTSLSGNTLTIASATTLDITGTDITITGETYDIAMNAPTVFASIIENTSNNGDGLVVKAGINAGSTRQILRLTTPNDTLLANMIQFNTNGVTFVPGATGSGQLGTTAVKWGFLGVVDIEASTSILPATDNTGTVGSNALRWALVRATVVTTGDLEMVSEERNAHWIIQEEHDRLVAYNRKLNKKYEMMLKEIV